MRYKPKGYNMNRLKILAVLCAVTAAALCAGCSDGADPSSAGNKSKKLSASSQTADDSESKEKPGESQEDSEDPGAGEEDQLGEHILQAYDFLQNESYSMKIRYTDSKGEVTEIYRAVSGGDFYQRQVNSIGESGSIRVGEECYDYDLVCGIYRKSSAERLDSVIESVVEQKLPATSTHIEPQDAEIYDVEEYTYTGDTYITVMDFCFDRDTGSLVKYTVTYSVEGEDDVTETREFYDFIPSASVQDTASSESAADVSGADVSSSQAEPGTGSSESSDSSEAPADTDSSMPDVQEIDMSVFDVSFIQGLADFDNMTEERRLGYCQAIFVTAGITYDELARYDMTDDKLKTISYEDFTYLVYTCGYDS